MFKPKETSTEVINIRVTKSEKEALKKLSKEIGFTMSDTIRTCINYYIKNQKQLNEK